MQKVRIENSEFKIQNYNYASEFNKNEQAIVVEIAFKKELKVEINI